MIIIIESPLLKRPRLYSVGILLNLLFLEIEPVTIK
jgi:hypothetical protein